MAKQTQTIRRQIAGISYSRILLQCLTDILNFSNVDLQAYFRHK